MANRPPFATLNHFAGDLGILRVQSLESHTSRGLVLYVGEGSVSNALGPEVWISDSELVSTLYLECSFIQASARDHFALQSAPALQVIGFGGSATDACCSAVMQPHRASADAAAIDIRRNMMC